MAKPVGYGEAAPGKYAITSGEFSGAIWATHGSDGKIGKKTTRDGPKENEQASIDKNGVTVTMASPAKFVAWLHRADKASTVFKKGAAIEVQTIYGVRGKGATGTFSMTDGALTVSGQLMLAGQTFVDAATGVFNQSGGTVSVGEFSLCLTGANTLSNSTQATGIYNLSGGVLRITAEKSKPGLCGILKGVGKGVFNWTGGTLDARRLSEDLTNNGGRLSPGGDGAVAETVLDSLEPRVYTQKTLGTLAVDIGGGSKYDRLIWSDQTKASKVVFERGSKIDVNLLGTYKPTAGRGFPVVSADAIVLEGALDFEGKYARDFSYEVVADKRGKQTLRLEYTPGRGGVKLPAKK